MPTRRRGQRKCAPDREEGASRACGRPGERTNNRSKSSALLHVSWPSLTNHFRTKGANDGPSEVSGGSWPWWDDGCEGAGSATERQQKAKISAVAPHITTPAIPAPQHAVPVSSISCTRPLLSPSQLEVPGPLSCGPSFPVRPRLLPPAPPPATSCCRPYPAYVAATAPSPSALACHSLRQPAAPALTRVAWALLL